MGHIHPTADVQSTHIGRDTRIWQFCVVLPGAIIGNDCNINAQVLIENDVILGDNVTVKPGVQLWDGLRISDNVFIGPNATFTNDLNPRSRQRPEAFTPTVVEHQASIGANATIVAGVTIGAYAMVGAGAVVTRNVPPHGLVYGAPASLQGYVCECGSKLDKFYCHTCGAQYERINSMLNRTEQNRTEQNRTEQNRTEQNRTEQNR